MKGIYLEPEESRAIIGSIWAVSKHPDRDCILLDLLWQSGARVSEALGLVPERVGLTSVGLDNLKQRKGKEDPIPVKEVEVTQALCNRIKSFCNANNIKKGDWIFQSNRGTNQLSRWYVWWIVNKASEYVRVYKLGKRNRGRPPRFKGAWPHLFRHSNAMYLLEFTGDISLVQQQLGHRSIKTTQEYAYTKRPKIRKAISEMDW